MFWTKWNILSEKEAAKDAHIKFATPLHFKTPGMVKVVRHTSYFLHCFRLPSTWQTYCLTFYLKFFLTSCWHEPDILSDTSRGWGPARNTGLTGSRLRSAAEHWTHRIAVEVRRGTLNSPDRGWGPPRNTELTGSRLRSGTETELAWSRLRSAAEHWTHRIAVEVRQRNWARMIAVEVRHGTVSSHDRGWGPAENTELIWTRRIAVEVRHGTLNSQDRSWGPARNTEHT